MHFSFSSLFFFFLVPFHPRDAAKTPTAPGQKVARLSQGPGMVCGGPVSGSSWLSTDRRFLGKLKPLWKGPLQAQQLQGCCCRWLQCQPGWQTPNTQPIWVALSLSQASVPGQGRRAVPGHGHCWHLSLCSRGDAQGYAGSEPGHGEVWENLPPTVGSELSSNSCQVLPEP